MELPVYTSLLRVERMLYTVLEWRLPRPVPLIPAMVFLGSCGLTWLVYHLTHIKPTLGPIMLAVLTPAALAWAASQPVADFKKPHHWVLTQLLYLFGEPRLLAGLRPIREPARARLRTTFWQEEEA